MKDGWSVKKLHRHILLSATYRQSSNGREEVAKADPENKLLAIFPRKRLEAEEIRDSILVASGKLNEQVGGPSVFPPVPANLTGGGNFNADPSWTTSKDPEGPRAPQPLHLHAAQPALSAARNLRHGECAADPQQARRDDDAAAGADALSTATSSSTGRRRSPAASSTRSGWNEDAQLERLYQILFARPPKNEEKEALTTFLDQHQKTIVEKAEDGKLALAVPVGVKAKPEDPLSASAFVDLVHTVVNSNEFVYRF